MMMKNRAIGKILWRGKFIILVVALLSLAGGLTLEKLKSPAWKTTLPAVIAPKGEDKTGEFKYDHYYSAQAIDSLTDSLEEWLKTPSAAGRVKKDSKVDFRDQSWKWWEEGKIKVRKRGPQIIEISYYTRSAEDAKLVEKILRVRIQQFLNDFNKSGEPLFYLTNSSSAVQFLPSRWEATIVISLLWGILIGILIVLEAENLRRKR